DPGLTDRLRDRFPVPHGHRSREGADRLRLQRDRFAGDRSRQRGAAHAAIEGLAATIDEDRSARAGFGRSVGRLLDCSVAVVGTWSLLADTLALRRRSDSGEVPGPSILSAGAGLARAGGSPYYILPARLPELARPEDVARVEAELAGGADIVKLFTGSCAAPRSIVVMPLEIARAAVEAGHRRGKLVFAHPSNSPGARVAI